MKCYSIIFNTPQTEEWIADYIEPATQAVARYGGKILARGAYGDKLEKRNGEWRFFKREIIIYT